MIYAGTVIIPLLISIVYTWYESRKETRRLILEMQRGMERAVLEMQRGMERAVEAIHADIKHSQEKIERRAQKG